MSFVRLTWIFGLHQKWDHKMGNSISSIHHVMFMTFLVSITMQILFQQLHKSFPLKLGFGNRNIYLCVKFCKTRLHDGIWAWEINPIKYVWEAVRNHAVNIAANHRGRFRPPKKEENTFKMVYDPELNTSVRICITTMPISQDIGIVVMHILTKVHHKPRYVHWFINYPRVFIPVAQDRQFLQSASSFNHLSLLPMLHPFICNIFQLFEGKFFAIDRILSVLSMT